MGHGHSHDGDGDGGSGTRSRASSSASGGASQQQGASGSQAKPKPRVLTAIQQSDKRAPESPQALDSPDIQRLGHQFHFSTEHVRSLYERFKSNVHGEYVDKESFKAILREAGVENEHVAEHWFEVCDPNGDGRLVFREFLTAVALMEHGSWQERAAFAFRCYDVDNNGTISKDELYQMMLSTQKFLDRLAPRKNRKSAEERAQFAAAKAMEYADKNSDGEITEAEFMTWVQESVIFESGVDIFLPASTAVAALVSGGGSGRDMRRSLSGSPPGPGSSSSGAAGAPASSSSSSHEHGERVASASPPRSLSPRE